MQDRGKGNSVILAVRLPSEMRISMKIKRKILIVGKLFLIGLLLCFMPVGVINAEGSSGKQAVSGGVTYTYRESREFRNAVEITGASVSGDVSVLKIPEVLDGKKVISVDFDRYFCVHIIGEDQTDAVVKKLVLPKSIRPVKAADNTGKMKYVPLDGLSGLEHIEVDPQNKFLKAQDGVLYNKDMTALLGYPEGKTASEYRMPSSITCSMAIRNRFIKKVVFSTNKKYKTAAAVSCDRLESIYLPDNITKVQGFNWCYKLKKIRWSKNLREIHGFKNCSSLKKIKIPDKVKVIGEESFRWCRNLEGVSFPSGLRKIEGSAFGGCLNLKKISPLPSSTAYIGIGAFAGTPGIKKVKKASYLLSSQNKKIKGKVGGKYRYVAVITLTKGKKRRYFDSQRVYALKSLENNLEVKRGSTKTLGITPGITESTPTGFWKGWKFKTDILKFTSSNPRVAKVSQKGKVTGIRKGRAEITVRMRTLDVKCKIKVKVTR